MKNIRIILIKIATQIFLLLLALITLLPFVYIILISFGKNVISAGAKIPKEFTFDNYKELFQATKFLNWLSNSLIIGLCTMVITVILVSVTVYVFSVCASSARKTVQLSFVDSNLSAYAVDGFDIQNLCGHRPVKQNAGFNHHRFNLGFGRIGDDCQRILRYHSL